MTASMAFQPPTNNNNNFAGPHPGPSPPETYLYSKNAYNTADPTMQTPPSSEGASSSTWNLQSYRQLREPRQPLYLPAALRPTELPKNIPARPRAPDTPPASKDNSFDGKKSASASMLVDPVPLPRPSTAESSRRPDATGVSVETSPDSQQAITEPPTKAHWKPDALAKSCSACHSTFTWYFRRHHCRHCGEVFCAWHCSEEVPLDENARFHPAGIASKACGDCAQKWHRISMHRNSCGSELANLVAENDGETALSPQISSSTPNLSIPRKPTVQEQMMPGSMAHSEGGMVWSTF